MPEKIRIRMTSGTGRWTAANHLVESLGTFARQYPKGILPINTVSASELNDIIDSPCSREYNLAPGTGLESLPAHFFVYGVVYYIMNIPRK